MSAQAGDHLKNVSLSKTTIQSLADVYKRQSSSLPDALKELVLTLYGAPSLETWFLWGLRSFSDIQGLHTLRCRPHNKGHNTNIIDAALNRLHHCFPVVSSQAQLKCFIVEADPICPHPYFRPVIRSTGSIMPENPRTLAPEHWEHYYPYVFPFRNGVELIQHQPSHRFLAELNHKQWEALLQNIHEIHGVIDSEQIDTVALMDSIADVCR
ncbi:MAG: hypothetical protein AAGD25_02505 [Cyanobacteria bacterium P01_F01_bin.150]